MTKLGNRNRDEWARQLWDSLISYANASDSEATAAFTLLVNAGMEWIGGKGTDSHGNLNDLAQCIDIHEAKGVQQLDAMANNYLPKIRELLTWLANPYERRSLANQSAYFLMVFGADIQMEWTSNDKYRPGAPLLTEKIEACQSVLSPVCCFIKDQIDRHDLHGEPLSSAIPIILCDRPGCGRFRLVKTARPAANVFCSNLCKAKFHQSQKSLEEKADDMRTYRATIDRNKATRKAVRGGKR